MHNSKPKLQASTPQTDADSLFESNKMNLKAIFALHSPHENRISLTAFGKFCKNSHIIPDLLSVIDLKRIITRITQNQNNKSSFTYQNFEQSLKYIAITGFHTSVPLSDKLQMLFLHIRNPCKKAYKVNLSTSLKSRSTTPFSCDTSGSEWDENKCSQRANAYAQKLGLNKTSGSSNIKLPLDIESVLGLYKKSPLQTKSTQRIRASPKKIIPCSSYKSISQDTSPHSRVTIIRKKTACTTANSRRNSQDLIDQNKIKEIYEATAKFGEKRHYRTMSAETYMIQSPKFGGSSSSPENTCISSNSTPKPISQKSGKINQIEKLFKNFKEKSQNPEKGKNDKEPHLTSLRKHRDYIGKVREASFSKNVITRMIFNAWKGLRS
ncbi:unnamed protein product [Blepharisma stoltei]|uniref:Uncharacterized protein n=1 Tax=Blepharisma stoltei TaxID=1481888 RepID=A0AAU9JX70_9CILI|nr:unnamed protein product [Blepharisma stoltei]